MALLPGIAGICFVFLGQTAALLKVSPWLFVSKRNFILSCNECIVGCLIDKCIYDLERTTFTRIILAEAHLVHAHVYVFPIIIKCHLLHCCNLALVTQAQLGGHQPETIPIKYLCVFRSPPLLLIQMASIESS